MYVLGIGVLGLNAASKAKVVLCSDSNEYVDEVFDRCADTLPEVINVAFYCAVMRHCTTLYDTILYYTILDYIMLCWKALCWRIPQRATYTFSSSIESYLLSFCVQGDQDKVFYENLTAEDSIEQGKWLQL